MIAYEELLEVARSREEVLGLYVFGSRGRGFTVDERSDWDECDREFPYAHGARVEIVSVTLDKTGSELPSLVAELKSLPSGSRDVDWLRGHGEYPP